MIILAQGFVDDRVMYLLAFLLFGGLAMGIIAIGVSLFNSSPQGGITAGLLSIGWGLVSPPMVLLLFIGKLSHPEARSILLIFSGPILPGLLAIWIARSKSSGGVFSQQNRKRLLRYVRILFAVVVGGGLLTGGYFWGRSVFAGIQMMAILDGSEAVLVTEFKIGSGVICRDRALCDYMSKMLRGAGRNPSRNGNPCSFSFRFSSGMDYTVENGHLLESGFSASIPEANPPELGFETHAIGFPTPIPPRIQEMWNFLLYSIPEDKTGMVMIVEEGDQLRWEVNPRFNHRASSVNWKIPED